MQCVQCASALCLSTLHLRRRVKATLDSYCTPPLVLSYGRIDVLAYICLECTFPTNAASNSCSPIKTQLKYTSYVGYSLTPPPGLRRKELSSLCPFVQTSTILPFICTSVFPVSVGVPQRKESYPIFLGTYSSWNLLIIRYIRLI